MVQGTPMLMFGEAGDGGQGNGRRIMVLGTFVAPSSRTSKVKRACLLLSLCAGGIPTFIPASSSMSPALQPVPSKLSFSNIPSLYCLIAPQWSITTPAHIVVVAVALLDVVVIVTIVWKSCTVAIGTDVDAGGTGWIGMGMGVGFVAMAAVGVGRRHCGASWYRLRLHGWINRSAASTEGLRGGWGQDMCNPGLLGPPDAWKEAKKQLEVRRGEARQWSKGDKKLHSHSIAARLVGPQRSSAQIKYLRKEHKKS
ncbi:hypothetical protein ARMGADRAFT_1065211 [Armillaria gallica]|uniref:Uncharacterized protein n=1 Tax=Armillaria gallica TaxID=47427 RepID=A0A2H3D275_ARMGA|nr:hypothetical protein ARMGADRAFT_1065211 [Armillaria gallica]